MFTTKNFKVVRKIYIIDINKVHLFERVEVDKSMGLFINKIFFRLFTKKGKFKTSCSTIILLEVSNGCSKILVVMFEYVQRYRLYKIM